MRKSTRGERGAGRGEEGRGERGEGSILESLKPSVASSKLSCSCVPLTSTLMYISNRRLKVRRERERGERKGREREAKDEEK